jgi:hypothetical protein
MAYGELYWMRLFWSSDIIKTAWNNYGMRRTNARWNELYQRKLAMEATGDLSEDEVYDSDTEVNEDEGESGVVSRTPTPDRILWDQLDFSHPYFGDNQQSVTPPDVSPEDCATTITECA